MYSLMQHRASSYAVQAFRANYLPIRAFYTVIYIILQLSKD